LAFTSGIFVDVISKENGKFTLNQKRAEKVNLLLVFAIKEEKS
jgi:hypothetical protein